MFLQYNKNLRAFSRDLRLNATDAEKLLWSKIRGKQLQGLQFYRQKVIDNYIVDFYCPKAKLAVELDGGQHYTPEGRAKDGLRDGKLSDYGIRVLRFSDVDVLTNTTAVLQRIWDELLGETPVIEGKGR